jgi:hypothetical protein
MKVTVCMNNLTGVSIMYGRKEVEDLIEFADKIN